MVKEHVVELLCILNITPLEQEGEEIKKEVNSAHVAGLNTTVNQQDREDSGTQGPGARVLER